MTNTILKNVLDLRVGDVIVTGSGNVAVSAITVLEPNRMCVRVDTVNGTHCVINRDGFVRKVLA
jgi:glutamate dehydrogenase/leucine dehydrogenase